VGEAFGGARRKTFTTKPAAHSESSTSEDGMRGGNEANGPGGIGSYLARQEFGSGGHEGFAGPPPNQDSGYASRGSGGGYPKVDLAGSGPIESFTMSVDRGFLGKPPVSLDGELAADAGRFRSMENLSGGQPSAKEKKANTGTELLRLLRVGMA